MPLKPSRSSVWPAVVIWLSSVYSVAIHSIPGDMTQFVRLVSAGKICIIFTGLEIIAGGGTRRARCVDMVN